VDGCKPFVIGKRTPVNYVRSEVITAMRMMMMMMMMMFWVLAPCKFVGGHLPAQKTIIITCKLVDTGK
jgi:hypothetical protein